VILWVDAQLSPALAPWLTERFGVAAASVRHLGLRDSGDEQIFMAARDARATVLTKDSDFALLLNRFGPPPAVIWVRCGNTSNEHLKRLFEKVFEETIDLLDAGETLIEIADLF
jgi:predicted nuclease of predicted toxin-antitoxin system